MKRKTRGEMEGDFIGVDAWPGEKESIAIVEFHGIWFGVEDLQEMVSWLEERDDMQAPESEEKNKKKRKGGRSLGCCGAARWACWALRVVCGACTQSGLAGPNPPGLVWRLFPLFYFLF
jgi:hypothetical protein